MNLPNKLTVCRILLVPVFIVFAILSNQNGVWWQYLASAAIFAVASFTDFLDGQIARRRHLVTDFGKFADPLADKILTTVAFLYMMQAGVCDPLVLCIILAREFAVAGVRMVAAGAKEGRVIAANVWGKIKTVMQMLSILVYYIGMSISQTSTVYTVSAVLCWLCAAATLLSGIIYLWDNRSFIMASK